MRFRDGLYLTMDAVGSEVWGLIEAPVAFAELCTTLADRFEVDAERCEADVARFLEGLEAEGIVDVTGPA